MTAPSLAILWLRLRLVISACGPVACTAAVLCVAGAAALMWLLPQRALQARQQVVALALAALPATPPKPKPVSANQNLELFYGALGEKRYAERQVKTLFGLAAQTGLVLHQGEYQPGYDQNAKLFTYQLSLPVKGSYQAIWQFALQTLRAIPFASLDDISFRRETIGEASVDARLHFTLYLADDPAGAPR